MGRIQEGGVHTQKVSLAIGVIALIMVGAFLCCPFATVAADEGDVHVINITAETDFCGVNTSLTSADYTVKYTLNGDARYYYSAELLSSNDESSGMITSATGQLYSGTPCYRTITVTAPTESGDYRLVVSFYAVDDSSRTGPVIAEKTVPLKVVDPIVLSVTMKNEGSTAVKFTPYFVINGEKAEDSIPRAGYITIRANGSETFTYNYIVKDVEDTKYYVQTDDEIIKSSISGLGPDYEKTFYAHDADYSLVTTIVVIVLVVLAVILFFVMRKPVVNKGKPKGRR